MAGSLGAAEVIRKPFEAEELLSRLDRLRTASPTKTTG
jgi:DNA-binding response OmpR family regulator